MAMSRSRCCASASRLDHSPSAFDGAPQPEKKLVATDAMVVAMRQPPTRSREGNPALWLPAWHSSRGKPAKSAAFSAMRPSTGDGAARRPSFQPRPESAPPPALRPDSRGLTPSVVGSHLGGDAPADGAVTLEHRWRTALQEVHAELDRERTARQEAELVLADTTQVCLQ